MQSPSPLSLSWLSACNIQCCQIWMCDIYVRQGENTQRYMLTTISISTLHHKHNCKALKEMATPCFQAFMVWGDNMIIFWLISLYMIVGRHWHFGKMCYLHSQGNGIILVDTKVIRERGGFGFVSKVQEMFPNVPTLAMALIGYIPCSLTTQLICFFLQITLTLPRKSHSSTLL